ncbi:uncharacterized protein LOC131144722 [Malania oleifera]|uniref:uncharacterized protein LOC131144722 n=1 Tax=Malania oleifera TaxID=397392 RepID=UPI0025ADA9C2|nr:uncharacterized protein LOC131144722 [Malania oleifera]XP_057949541.1 uncharacterized protein LOC131144722 [Malania oleifera]XP_057949542.1 uncharacterized protein LOC131144722 [Malania oleifera]XP_057949543.1 uncharacterized protein LOC131144722 [Malania oleifera]
MVLGLRSKTRKGTSVQVDYLVSVQEIKPWPPSQSLRSIQSIVLQWENGDQRFGSLTANAGEGKIEFNESFRLVVTLRREASGKSRTRDGFHKNCLELYLYEPRRDKAAKGQLVGTTVINLADYGIIKETITINAPVSCKKSKNMTQPVMFVKIQPFEKDSSCSSPKGSLSEAGSLDKGGSGSVSELMNGENDEETEIASFTDDDSSSHSSQIISYSGVEVAGGSLSLNEGNGSESTKDSVRSGNGAPAPLSEAVPAKSEVNLPAEPFNYLKGSLFPLSSMDLSSNLGKPTNKNCPRIFDRENLGDEFHEKVAYGSAKVQKNTGRLIGEKNIGDFAPKLASLDTQNQVTVSSEPLSFADSQANVEDNGKAWSLKTNSPGKVSAIERLHASLLEDKEGMEQLQNGHQKPFLDAKKYSVENALISNFSQNAAGKVGLQGSFRSSDKLKHVKSVTSPISAKSNGMVNGNHLTEDAKTVDVFKVDENAMKSAESEKQETRNSFLEGNGELRSRIEMLEEELSEAAAVEAGLYSVVAEHGSSTNKVHAPARRLSRFYLHACKSRSQAGRSSAARAVVSGLVLVSKACGNDVPRLSFWLSNSIVLRVIVSQAAGEMLTGLCKSSSGSGKGLGERAPFEVDESSPIEKGNNLRKKFDDQEDIRAFIFVLEKIEAWIFSRIIESVWWQTLTPHMQSSAAKVSARNKGSNSRKPEGRRYGLGDHEQGSFSIDLWTKAFRDSCERLCPIRAEGHDCGCLSVLSRLIMEQLVCRLDVAMLNAILRESDEEMPTDPVSDPICDSKVLPIPAGKSSFGAGAQLKNAVGSWSRWLTDLFGIDDNDSLEDTELGVCKSQKYDVSFKAFHLLNALSDLMMLPLEMLADKSTRKEVCPKFGASLVKRVLKSFVPDEFCPDPIPETILKAVDSEDPLEDDKECITSIPCIAAPTVYSPPPAASLASVVSNVGNQLMLRRGSSVLRKSYTSDDELDELDSPLTSIVDNSKGSSTKLNWMLKESRNVVRYQLLREAWRHE